MDLLSIFYFLLVAALIILSLCLVIIYVTSVAYPDLGRYESEKFFHDPKRKAESEFPSIHDPPSVDLTVVVPAYNEEERLSSMMDEALEYLEDRQQSNQSFSFEIIVVDDGSKDKTSEVALTYSEKYGVDKVRVLTLAKNRGKGGAIRLGIFVGRGKLMLFADADGASKFSDYKKMEVELKKINGQDNMCVVCGSRAHLEKDSIAERSVFRTFLMYGFHFLVWFLCVRGVKDTQCGFKLMTREAAILLFSNLHVERWAFDVDMLYLAQHFKMPLGEVAIAWQEIDGSKMVPVWSWLQMGRDLLLIRLRYILGAWRINSKPKSE
ncbi:dolichyl-phosphate beta-glucosyltransferase-like [Haliotis rufescens]|uniref:dolichyl-phosphate beta-glucosyltransferase-like n=1 Tax=Haliotis rufescens TaxID=6454 RepID=UPI001EAFA5DB|nr:dolichyl-phosphate beta-glucosyltransferase-like [Haliotis rufescens]